MEPRGNPPEEPSPPRRDALVFLGIAALALALRFVHLLQARAVPIFGGVLMDGRSYSEWADRIAAGDWLGGDTVFYQAPVYPYFLALVKLAVGDDLWRIRLVQIALGSLACSVLFLAGRSFFSRSAGIAAGLLLAVYPPAIFFDGLIQKANLGLVGMVLLLWLAARARSGLSPLRFVLVGAALAFLMLTREETILLVPVVAAWAWLTARERTRTRRLRTLGGFAAGLALVLLPVGFRNLRVGGEFVLTTSQAGPNFYIGNHAGATGTYVPLRPGRQNTAYERKDAVELAEQALGRTLSPKEVSDYWRGRAFDFIRSEPGSWMRLMARKADLLVNAYEAPDYEDQYFYERDCALLAALDQVWHFGILLPLGLAGIAWTRRRWRELWILHALLAASAAAVVLFYVFARYRYPLAPMLVILAAAGLVDAESYFAARGLSPAIAGLKACATTAKWPFAIVVTAAIVTNWPLVPADHMRAVTENNLGAAEQAERRFDEADAHYRRSIAFRSDYAPAYSNLGAVLRARGRNVESIAAYEQALKLQPEYADAHYNIGNALMDERRFAEAIEHFQIALRSAPASEEVHNNFGIALALAGRHDEALAEFTTAVRIKATSAKAQHNLADALLSAGRGAEALEHFQRATELAPEDGSFHYDYGSALLDARRPQDAVAEFRAALTSLPQSPEVHNNLGIALGSLGQLDEAIAEFQQALRAQPDFADARANLKMAAEARAKAR